MSFFFIWFFYLTIQLLNTFSTHNIHVKYRGAYFKTRFTWNHMKYFTWISCETRFTRGDLACVYLDFYPCVVYQKLTTLLKFQSLSSDNFMVSSASPQQSEKIIVLDEKHNILKWWIKKLSWQICFIWFSYEYIQNFHIDLICRANHMRTICILLHMISICLFIWFSYDLPHMILIWLNMHMIHICFSYDSHMKGNTYVYHMWRNCLCTCTPGRWTNKLYLPYWWIRRKCLQKKIFLAHEPFSGAKLVNK